MRDFKHERRDSNWLIQSFLTMNNEAPVGLCQVILSQSCYAGLDTINSHCFNETFLSGTKTELGTQQLK